MARQCPNCNTFLTSRAKYCRICGMEVLESAVAVLPSLLPNPALLEAESVGEKLPVSNQNPQINISKPVTENNLTQKESGLTSASVRGNQPISNSAVATGAAVTVNASVAASSGGATAGLPPTIAFVPPTEVLPPFAGVAADDIPLTDLLPPTSNGTKNPSRHLLLAPPTHTLIEGFTQAGFTLRLAAFMLDSLLLLAILLVTSLLASLFYTLWSGAVFISYILALMVGFYNYLIRAQGSGQTWGKHWVGIRVLNRNQQPVTTSQLWVRTLLGYPLALLPAGLGWIWLLWDRRQQGWHDHLAGTIVVKQYPE
jgi:uncharacterized RDD family membrane protein YckC